MDDETSINEMIIMPEEDYNEMEKDLNYWVAATGMLSEILSMNNIEHEVSEESVAEYLIRMEAELR